MERGIFEAPYHDEDPLPGNLQHWRDVAARDRESSPSPTQTEYDRYLDQSFPTYVHKPELWGDLKDWVGRTPYDHDRHHVQMKEPWDMPHPPNPEALDCHLVVPNPKPDYCEGMTRTILPRRVRDHLRSKRMPAELMVLPNYLVEVKGLGQSFIESRNQRRFAGAIAATGYDSTIQGFPAGPSIDNAYVASIGFNGEHMEAHVRYTAAPTKTPSFLERRYADYHMRRIHASNPSSSFDDYKRATRAFKNIRDEYRLIREDFIRRAEDYQILVTSPPSAAEREQSGGGEQ